jgi:hypothetical protein
MRILKRRPSPALIISIVALVLALAGTALGGVATISVLSKKEKRQVKKLAGKIADQRITTRAPGLSVASAKTADSAGNATNELWAVVNENGSLYRSTSGIVGSNNEGGGEYEVATDRTLNDCFFQATPGGNAPGLDEIGEVVVNQAGVNSNQVYVVTRDSNGTLAPHAFTLLIRC